MVFHKLFTLLPFIAITFPLPQATSPTIAPAEEVITNDNIPSQSLITYDDVVLHWQNEGSSSTGLITYVLKPVDARLGPNASLTSSFSYSQFAQQQDQHVIDMTENQAWVEYQVTVDQDILVQLAVDYFTVDSSIRNIEMAAMINGAYPYEEAQQLSFPKAWVTPHQFEQDRYGNDIMPKAIAVNQWQHQPAKDAQRLLAEPLLWRLFPGLNTLRLYRVQGDFLLGNITLQTPRVLPTYSAYLQSHQQGQLQTQVIQTYQAEHLYERNSLLTRFNTNREPLVTPFSLIEGKLNVIDGATFQHPGQSITYEIEVPASGFYFLTWKVLQNRIQSISYRRLMINGEVPFQEAHLIPFHSSRVWEHRTLASISGDPFQFYFSAGRHVISLEVNTSPIRSSYLAVRRLMNELNELSLAIKKITGNTVDPNREWDLIRFLPTIGDTLDSYIDTLDEVIEDWQTLMQANLQSDVIASLNIAKRLLTTLRNDINSIPRRIETLTGSSGSVLYRLGIILPLLIQSPLTIDAFYFHGHASLLPEPRAGFFLTMWVGIQRFFGSFFSDQFRESSNPNELVVWVSRSRQYVNLMQQMVDAQFTPLTGIPVRISINPNEDKLILASSANKQPDIAMGVAGWRPYDFAIRNNLYDLTSFPDFRAVSDRFYPGSFLQLIYQDGVYGLPETQNFYLLFYRQDIMDRLDLDVPDTWNDVIGILPELQRFGMNFYSMLSSSNAFKAFVLTMPFIRQFNGRIFSEDGLSAAYDDPNTIEALTLMTDLFTTYSLPVEVGSFYNEFRYGRLPIGIGDFGMYISLLHAAPEIAGLWNIAPLPGILQDGEVNRSFDGSSTSAMMFQQTSKPQEAWSFLKWWTSASTQLDYSENLISAYGPEYLWNTSNREAFSQMSWDENHRQTILDQWQWIEDTAKTPASYMVERELSNIWNKVVFQGVNLRTAIEDSMIIANKEIRRKMIEFRFIDPQGNVLRPYILPTQETLESWIGSRP